MLKTDLSANLLFLISPISFFQIQEDLYQKTNDKLDTVDGSEILLYNHLLDVKKTVGF